MTPEIDMARTGSHRPFDIAVAGHICLDIIPAIPALEGGLDKLLAPGRLTRIGPAAIATGGSVPNVGLALHRLGLRTMLSGKVGDDALGAVVLNILRSHDPALADGMIVAPGEPTSYTIVINVPGVDRAFLHCPGVNDTYCAADPPYERLGAARCVHFGYPPLMRRLYADGGRELAEILRRLKDRGLTTSLDLAAVDPASDAGRVNWPALLEHVLGLVDVFLPSLDEIAWMFRLAGGLDDGRLARQIARRVLDMGVAVVALKLGDQGLFVQTSADAARLRDAGSAAPADSGAWAGRQMLAPCFQVDVAGTTGSGDCTIAGFLAGLVKGLPVEQAVTAAVAVGACSVEQPDATSGVPSWEAVQRRIAAGWARRPVSSDLPSWSWRDAAGLYLGPDDAGR
jgi:sugar/nucleoside kinase (ribokinase family)